MKTARRASTSATAGLLWVCGALAFNGCANEQPPPGALPDHEPPRIESIEPAPDSIVPGFDGQVRIRFDEPVRVERGSFGQQLIASPMEAYTVETGFSDIRLRPRDGWRDSVAYCLEIPAGIRDVLSNQTPLGTEFCFSTGGPLIDSQVTGTILDAVTGSPQTAASVVFLAGPDSVPYGALTDPSGRFQLRSLPPGSYDAFGFMDQNRNFRVDKTLEPYDSTTVESFSGARPDLLFTIVEPDSTPPRLLRADTPDSLTVRLEFDEPLLRTQPGAPTVAIADSASGAAVPIVGFGVGEPDSVFVPGAPLADSTAVRPDTAAAQPPPVAGPPAEGAPADSLPSVQIELPSRFVTVRLSRAIVAGPYRVRSDGFVNLRRLSGGGDTTFVAEPVPLDTLGVVPDSAAVGDSVGIDSLGVAADTLGILGDTLDILTDSVSTPPDTVPPPDTLVVR